MKRNHKQGQEPLEEKQGKHTGNRWLAMVDHWDFLFTFDKNVTDTLHIGTCTYTHSENQNVSKWLVEIYTILHFIYIYLHILLQFEGFFVCLINLKLFSGFRLRVLAFSKSA